LLAILASLDELVTLAADDRNHFTRNNVSKGFSTIVALAFHNVQKFSSICFHNSLAICSLANGVFNVSFSASVNNQLKALANALVQIHIAFSCNHKASSLTELAVLIGCITISQKSPISSIVSNGKFHNVVPASFNVWNIQKFSDHSILADLTNSAHFQKVHNSVVGLSSSGIVSDCLISGNKSVFITSISSHCIVYQLFIAALKFISIISSSLKLG